MFETHDAKGESLRAEAGLSAFANHVEKSRNRLTEPEHKPLVDALDRHQPVAKIQPGTHGHEIERGQHEIDEMQPAARRRFQRECLC